MVPKSRLHKLAVSKPSQKFAPRPSSSQTEKEVPRKQRTPAKHPREEPSTSIGRQVQFKAGTPSTIAQRGVETQTSESSDVGARRRGTPATKGQVLKIPTTYFKTELQHSRFYKSFYERKVFVPKIIDFKFLSDYEFEIEELLDFQGWTRLLKADDRVYPDLTRIFYYLWDDQYFSTFVKGVEMFLGTRGVPSLEQAIR